jgi:flagellar protein FlbD
MLAVTRFNGTEMLLNPELILYIESIPDTIVTLTNGEKIYVKEKSAEVQRRFMEYKKNVFSEILVGELKVKGD